MTVDRSGEWLAPVTPLHRVSPETAGLDTDEFDEFDSDGSNDIDVHTIALRALGRRAMSIREMEKLLRDRDADQAAIAEEINVLESTGLLNDDELAIDLGERLQRRKGMGSSAIKAELVKRLIKPSSIDLAIESLPGDQTEFCREQAAARLDRLRGYDRDVQYRRLHSFLARRGFRSTDISAALNDVLGDSRRGPSDSGNVIAVTFRDAD